MAALTAIGDKIWMDTAPVRFLGLRLTSNMTVLRLPDGSLLVDAPVAMTPERRAAVEGLGRVVHLYVPNLFHHLHLGTWASCQSAAPGWARQPSTTAAPGSAGAAGSGLPLAARDALTTPVRTATPPSLGFGD